MAIDPLSVATQGYVINNDPKQIFAVTLATLGYIKPEIAPEEVARTKFGGGRSGRSNVALSYKRFTPPKKPEYAYNLTIKAGFTKVNNEEVDQKMVVKRYSDSHKPIGVNVQHLVHKNDRIELGLFKVFATSVKPKIKVENVKQLPLRTFVSSSIKFRTKKK